MKSKERQLSCKYLDIKERTWIDFKQFILRAKGTGDIIMRLTNKETTSELMIEKEIEYNFNASYARVLPSDLFQKEGTEKSTKETSKSSKKDNQFQKEFASLVIFKNLERKRIVTLPGGFKRREYIPKEDLYHIIGFKTKRGDYSENIEDLSNIRRKISRANFRLRYHENGLKFQIAQRIRYLTFKSMKLVLVTLAHLAKIPTNLPNNQAIAQLMELYEETEPQKMIKQIIYRPEFFDEIRSIVYKIIISYGLFPSFVEINTMAEGSVVLWLKKLVSNVVSAPWSSNYHTSFSLGNHRYSFIYIPDDKSLQNKVNVSFDIRREFRSSHAKFNYFRLKFFEFFPMNSWIDEMAIFIQNTLKYFKVLEEDDGIQFSKLTEIIEYKLNGFMDKQTFPQKIASEFNERYKELFCKESKNVKSMSAPLPKNASVQRNSTQPQQSSKELAKSMKYEKKSTEKHYELVFLKFTELIADAEIRGYSQFSNNCQTVVSEVVSLFCLNFQEFVEPLLDVQALDLQGDALCKEKIDKDFALFSSYFNRNFEIQVKPFPLTHRLSYFATYTDVDTYNHLKPENYEKIKQLFDKYVKREDVDRFIGTLISSYPKLLDELREYLSARDQRTKSIVGEQKFPSFVESTQLSKSTEQVIDSSFKESVQEAKLQSFIAKESKIGKNSSLASSVIETSKSTSQTNEEFSYISHLVHVLGNKLFDLRKEIKIRREKIREIDSLLKNQTRNSIEKPETTTKSKDALKPKEIKKKTEEKETLSKELEVMYKQKYEVAHCYREVCYYYFNSIRLGLLTKFNDTASYIGFLLIRNPEHGFNKGNPNESTIEIDSKTKQQTP